MQSRVQKQERTKFKLLPKVPDKFSIRRFRSISNPSPAEEKVHVL